MILRRSFILTIFLLISSCAFQNKQGTIAQLDNVHIELKDTQIEGGLEKAMQGYQKFLKNTPDSTLTPEAIRRLADLKLEKEYGVVADGDESDSVSSSNKHGSQHKTEDIARANLTTTTTDDKSTLTRKEGKSAPAESNGESDKEFERRTTQQQKIQQALGAEALTLPKGEVGSDLQNADADEAIALYRKLLKKYPRYEHNDQVLYQLSRAYGEIGQVDEAMQVMNQLVKQYPQSRYTDEVQFRRGEYYFTRKKYLYAEDAYGAVLKFGVSTVYYQRALYKKGWTFYKEQMYEEALQQFIALLDYKVSIGYDFDQTKDKIESNRVSDTFRVISLSLSNLGGPSAAQDYFRKYGSRAYEARVYRALGEYYFNKRRYSDAAATYNTFVASNPFHKLAPQFSMRVIEIYMKGGFPRLVVDAKKQFASTYALDGEYWQHFNQSERPEVLDYLKENLIDLADHYHSLYQNKQFIKNKPENFAEAEHWYREFLKSFPKDKESSGINYQLAELLLENRDYKAAAIEYEHGAYDYPVNEKSPKAAYATVYAYREYLKTAPVSQANDIKREIVRTSLRLVDTFPKHEKATVVLGAIVDDLFEMRNYELAIKVGHRLIDEYPKADTKIIRGAWLVVAHSSYEIKKYQDAEQAYIETLKMTAADAKDRQGVVDDLAASVYKQGEVAKTQGDYKTAVRHFLRIAKVAPTSKIRPTAEYDAAAVLIQIKDLNKAESVLLSFRNSFPGNKLQKDVTSKLAYVYQDEGKNIPAAHEYERVAANESKEDVIREAMLTAAELYEKEKDTDDSLRVYKQYVDRFPKPLEPALETYYKIATIYKLLGNERHYRGNLLYIIKADSEAGKERTDRTRYLAAQSSLAIIEPRIEDYMAIKLVKPFKLSLNKKEKSMKSLVRRYTKLVDYHVADVTAASTYHIAEIYYNFSRSLLESQRPDNLSGAELDEFNEMLEEQAYPFENKAIQVHEHNVALIKSGIYSPWIDRSIEKLAKLVPARYGKPEQDTNFITKIGAYTYISPRYQRDDASTGFIANMKIFRYTSQKKGLIRNKRVSGADSNAEAANVSKPENDSTVQPVKAGKPRRTEPVTASSKVVKGDGAVADAHKVDEAQAKAPDPQKGDVSNSSVAQEKPVAPDVTEEAGKGNTDKNAITDKNGGVATKGSITKSKKAKSDGAVADAHKVDEAQEKTPDPQEGDVSNSSVAQEKPVAPDATEEAGKGNTDKNTITDKKGGIATKDSIAKQGAIDSQEMSSGSEAEK